MVDNNCLFSAINSRNCIYLHNQKIRTFNLLLGIKVGRPYMAAFELLLAGM